MQIMQEADQDKLKEILANYEAVFDGKLDQMKGTYATLYVDSEVFQTKISTLYAQKENRR